MFISVPGESECKGKMSYFLISQTPLGDWNTDKMRYDEINWDKVR